MGFLQPKLTGKIVYHWYVCTIICDELKVYFSKITSLFVEKKCKAVRQSTSKIHMYNICADN